MLKRIVEFDKTLSARVRVAERPGPLRTLAAVLAHSGDSWFWLLGLGVLWLVGNDFWKRRVGILALGVLVTAAVVMAIKLVVKRRRPEGEWGGIYRSTDPHSFPSGHAARAIMLAVLAILLGPAWFAVILAVWAPFVALARVSMGLHYLSDVAAGILLGALLGAGVGLFFL
jgi:undecaprenyl-diphosphatase